MGIGSSRVGLAACGACVWEGGDVGYGVDFAVECWRCPCMGLFVCISSFGSSMGSRRKRAQIICISSFSGSMGGRSKRLWRHSLFIGDFTNLFQLAQDDLCAFGDDLLWNVEVDIQTFSSGVVGVCRPMICVVAVCGGGGRVEVGHGLFDLFNGEFVGFLCGRGLA